MYIVTDPYLVCKDHRLRYSNLNQDPYPELSDYIDCYSEEEQEDGWDKYYKAVSEWSERNKDDWEKSIYGKSFKNVNGIDSYFLLNDFLCDSWVNVKYKDRFIEKVHTLSGVLGVFVYEEVVKYNPAFTILVNEKDMNNTMILFSENTDLEQITVE